LFYGCPIFATPYGSLKELVPNEAGFLSNSETELANALKRVGDFDRNYCHNYAAENFKAQVMANNYLKLYEKVLNGESLHTIAPEFKDRNIQKEKYLEMLP
jgi:glycosyltransferase involved in cell wall biosynthesis